MTKIYEFEVCLICEQEIDESNGFRHEGPTHDVQTVKLVPLVPAEQEEGAGS